MKLKPEVLGVIVFILAIWLIAISGTALECYDVNKNFKPRITTYDDTRAWVQWSLGLSFVVLALSLAIISGWITIKN